MYTAFNLALRRPWSDVGRPWSSRRIKWTVYRTSAASPFKEKSQSEKTTAKGKSSVYQDWENTIESFDHLRLNFPVGLGVHHFLHDFSRMSARIEMVGVRFRFLLCALFTAVASVNVLIIGEIVMLVLIEVALGLRRHFNVFLLHFTRIFAHCRTSVRSRFECLFACFQTTVENAPVASAFILAPGWERLFRC